MGGLAQSSESAEPKNTKSLPLRCRLGIHSYTEWMVDPGQGIRGTRCVRYCPTCDKQQIKDDRWLAARIRFDN